MRPMGMQHGRVYDVGPGRVAVTFVSNPELDGKPVRVELVLVPDDGDEHKVTLAAGDRFEVGGDVWTMTGVDNVGTWDYVVRIAPVAAGG